MKKPVLRSIRLRTAVMRAVSAEQRRAVQGLLTILDRVNSSSSRQCICQHDTTPDRHASHAQPPANDIAHQVDLLPRFVVRPEADTTQQEWPAEGLTRVWVGRRKTGIMLEHEDLKFGKLFEKVDVSDGLVLEVTRSVLEVVTS